MKKKVGLFDKLDIFIETDKKIPLQDEVKFLAKLEIKDIERKII